MKPSESLRVLADVLDTFENAGYGVREFVPAEQDVVDEGTTRTRLALELPGETGVDETAVVDLDPRSMTVTEDGRFELVVEVGVDASGNESDAAAPASSRTTRARTEDPPETDPDGDDAVATADPYDGDKGTAVAGADPGGTGDAVAGGDASRDGESGTDDGEGADDTPAHRDPDRLRAVYDEDLTFAEMRDALEVEVTPQTVRKHMVKHGIHDADTHATSYGDTSTSASERSSGGTDADDDTGETGSGGDAADDVDETGSEGDAADDGGSGHPSSNEERAESADASRDGSEPDDRPGTDDDRATDPVGTADVTGNETGEDGGTQPLPDDVDVPADLTMDAVVEAVHTRRTLYEVQQSLDLDREPTRRLLDELDLLELVQGRLAEKHTGTPTKAEIEGRLQ